MKGMKLFLQIAGFFCILFLLERSGYGQESNTEPREHNTDRMVVILWDVGGGNFFIPTARISVDAFPTHAAEIKLFSVHSGGDTKELQSFTCRDGSRINFIRKYNRAQTQALEILLYDSQGKLLASINRKVN